QLVPLLDEYGGVVALCAFNHRSEQAAGSPASVAATEADQEDTRLQQGIATARRLAQRLAHDFNNIIAVVQGYAELLHGRLEQDQEGRNMAEMIRQMSEEATAVTTRLAAFASVRPLDPAEVDLNQVLRDFLSSPQGAAPPGVEVGLELAADLPPLLADQTLLERVCVVLWQNALDAMPQGGRICWQTELVWEQPRSAAADRPFQHPLLRLRITDTGVGMDEATRRAIFDPFFTTKHGRSRGLGLTEVYATVKAHHGSVQVFSVPGSGTSLDLYFPVRGAAEQAQARPVAEEQAPKAGETAGRQAGRWLLADDNRLIRLLLEQLLPQAGHEVVTAASGREALAIYQRQRGEFDGVILDLDLGDMPGAQVFQGLREINHQVRVIILSGDPHQLAVGELMVQGCWGLLAKPFRREDVVSLLNQARQAWAALAHPAVAA
ncbi:MAG TPA: response regulator, partial [Dehalococcoidia bacterium]|nr:response regulator [Dehalococcoidia bacterium]